MHQLTGDGDGQTPLDPDEAEGLIPSWIATRGDLDRAEQENIAAAVGRMQRRRLTPNDILSEPFLRQLHRRMFGDVWKWAGTYRGTAKNIGVDAWRIPEELGQLLGDVTYWVANATYPPDEIALRFHHRLASIHPFPNGNGRHSRLAADLLAETLGCERFSWGRHLGEDAAAVRRTYFEALHAADRDRLEPLLEFARS